MACLLRCSLVMGLLASWASASAAPSIEAAGLMRDMAILLIDDRKEILRVGQRSSSGVLLLAANAERAIVEVEGRSFELALSQRVGGHYAEPVGRSVQIDRDRLGQFRTAGSVNGQTLSFLVDTGATLLAMSSQEAQRIGLDYRSGEPGRVTTASGVTRAWFMTLDQVTVGEIRVTDVRAAIVQGAFPSEALLGMSFLRHVGFAEEGGVLTLLQRF